jgi:hypothetical protein
VAVAVAAVPSLAEPEDAPDKMKEEKERLGGEDPSWIDPRNFGRGGGVGRRVVPERTASDDPSVACSSDRTCDAVDGESIGADTDALPLPFPGLDSEREEEKVEEGEAVADCSGRPVFSDDGEPLLSEKLKHQYDKSMDPPTTVIYHPMRDEQKRSVAALAATQHEEATEQEPTPSFGVVSPSPPSSSQNHSEEVPFLRGPGAYRVQPWREPQRASQGDLSAAAEAENVRPTLAPPPPPPLTSRQGSIYMAEAELVAEEEEKPLPLLVEARLVQRWCSRKTTLRRWQIAIFAVVALAMITLFLGLFFGSLRPEAQSLAPTASPTLVPTASPTPQLERQFKPTLPAYTRERLPNATSPQGLAFDWVMKKDKVPMLEAPGDDQLDLRLERMKQRFALATLFFATGGKTAWKDKKGWINATLHECQWFGCRCSSSVENAVVAGLELSFNYLAGSLPREIALLPSLTSIKLRKNALTGPLPTELGSLTLLTTLALNENLFSGVIPTEVGLLTSLQVLFLDGNGFFGEWPGEISSLSKLLRLDLSQNLLRGSIPTTVGMLSNLLALSVGQNDLSATLPKSLGNMAHLLRLDVHGNKLTGPIPPQLGKLEALERLDLSSNQLSSSIPSTLGRLTKLTYVDLSSNFLTGSVPIELCQWKNSLSDLFIDCVDVTCNCNCTCASMDDVYSYYESR